MQWLFILSRIVWLSILLWGSAAAAQDFLAGARDREFLQAAIEAERPDRPPPAGLTGITVPHHLLVPELISRGFWAASEGDYDRILLLSPDHYRSVKGPFATSLEPNGTVFGKVPVDHGAARELLDDPLFELHEGAEREHGTAALMPFIAWFFPDVPVVTVVSSSRAEPADWRHASMLLENIVTSGTLVIQSTDYSHLLPVGAAVVHDQQTINVIMAGEPKAVIPLRQADHLDSKASQFLQMQLQRDVFGARAAILANRNSASDGVGTAKNVTSYIVSAFHPDPEALARLRYTDQDVLYVGGDTLLGRYMEPVLRDPRAMAAIFNRVLSITEGAPLVLNLEGVIVDGFVANAPPGAHLMQAGQAIPILSTLSVSAVSLANNHSGDFGQEAHAQSRSLLTGAGIAAVEHGQVTDLGPVRVLGLTTIPARGPRHADGDDLSWICALEAAPPLIALLHWGQEYTAQPGTVELRLAEQLFRCGVSAVVGAHSHVHSADVSLIAGRPVVFSTGNFLFDQSFAPTSGSLVELRVFASGTLAMRFVPVGNLFNLGQAAMGVPTHAAGSREFGPYQKSSSSKR